MKKRIFSILLVICMSLNFMPATVVASSQKAVVDNIAERARSEPTTTFEDVSESDWFYSSVKYVIEQGIFKGTGDDTFSPNGAMTRGMYVTVMGHIAGVDPTEYMRKVSFADVDRNAYYAPYVAWAFENGITDGIGNNHFDPNGIVNREQMAVFTIRYFIAYAIECSALPEVTTTPGDLSGVSGWAKDSVLKLWAAGLLKGDNKGNFNPGFNATRAEVSSFSMGINEMVVTQRAENASPTQISARASLTPTPTSANLTSTPSPASGSKGNTNSGSREYYTVTFESNGGTDVSPVSVASGGTLSSLPFPNKTNAVFLGWYADSSFQGDEFSEKDDIYSNRTLYAKYLAIEGATENELDTSFSLPEQDSDLAISVASSSSSISAAEVKSGIMLEIINGSEPVNLTVNGSNGVFTVTAMGGFTEGASYKLTLSGDDLSFSDKDDIIRTCSFTIKKDEVFDIELNEGIVYIPSSDLSDIIKNGTPVNSLKVPLVDNTGDHSASQGTNSGTFTYKGIKVLNVGDVLCVYSGAKPVAGDDAAYLDEDIAYIEVTGKSGTTIDYTDADSKDILFLPDVLPIYAGVDSSLANYIKAETSGSFSVPVSSLDFSQYSVMGLNSETTIDKGDYLALYTCADLQAANENDIIYGKVTTITTSDGTANVAFDITTSGAMQGSLDYYSKNDIKGDAMLKDTDVVALQSEIEQQVYDSGFANKAAEYMTSIAMSTDSFKKIAGDNFILADNSQGADDSAKGIKLMGAASGMDAIKDLKISVNVGTDTKKLKDGVRCAVEVSFNIPIEVNDDSEVKINLSATFIEELKMTVNASGETVWKYWLSFIPYISEYNVDANIDVYDFTGIYFSSTITSNEAKDDGSGTKTEETDISQEIQDILSKTNTKVITAKVQSLFKDYSDMMENSHDWINIVDKEICSTDVAPILGILAVDASASFEVSIDVNVALGCNFEYQNGTRYCFWAKVLSAQAGSSTVSLTDETYNFQLYIMGTLGLRAGIKLGFAVGLFSTDLDSVGLTAEAGIYASLYGYFYYELKSVNGVKTSKKSGALYFELGAYLNISFEAQVLSGALDYNPTLYEDEWPILTAGNRYNVSDFAYTNEPDITMKDKIRTFTLPKGVFDMSYLDLKKGDVSKKNYSKDNFAVIFSDRHFGLVGNDIVVIVPENTHFMECDMRVLWKKSTLAFSSVPIERTFHITWDDLNDGGYIIIFNSNGGSAVAPIRKPYDASISAPSAPTKDGYTFAGWYSDKQLTIPYKFSKMGWDNIILYAKWTAKINTPYKVNHSQQDTANSSKYTLFETSSGLTGTTDASVTPAIRSYTGFTAPVTQTVTIAGDGSTTVNYYYTRNSYKLTFKPENGSADISTNVKYGASITAPIVTRTGYTFKEWNTAVLATMAAADTTYTAQWTVNTYTVSFDSNGGSSCNAITITYGSAYGKLPVPTRTGYTFSGWYTSETSDNGSGTQVTSATIANITSAQTLYAKWTASNGIPYKVEHYQQNINDNNYSLAETENLNGTTGATATATAKSYTGFTNDSNVTGTVGSGTIAVDGSLVLKMYYTRNSYTLTFDENGGTGGSSTQVKYGAEIAAPNVTKTGYTFANWSPDVASTMPAQDITYTAEWTAGSATAYKVEYYQQNVTGDSYTLTETENLSGTTGATATATAKSYTGYTYDSNVSGTVGSGAIVADGSLVLKIYYTRNSYTLTFDANGGTGGSSTQVKYDAEIAAPNVTKTGYTFANWSPTVASTMPAQDTTYTAQWTASNATAYKVDHYQQNISDNNYSLAETENLYGTTGETATATAESYTGFTYDSNISDTIGSGTIAADGSLVLKMYYTRNSYTLTFDANGGTGESSTQVKYGAEIEAPNVTKTGYTFANWSPAVASTMPAQDTTYTAQWIASNASAYKVEHYQQNISDNNYSLAETENLYGTTCETATATAESYTGFTYDSNISGTIGSGTIAADGSLVLKMYYTRNSYILTFDANGGTGGSSTQVKYGAEIAAPNVTKAGYTFANWSPDVASTMPTQDTIYTAEWTESNATAYKVEHYQQNTNDNYTLAQTENLNGTTGETATATAESYTGFTYDSNISGTIGSGTIAADGSLVLKMYYTRNSYILTFDANGGTGGSSTQVKYGAEIAAPNVTKAGYTFANWSPDVASTIPAQDTTYTAQWTASNTTAYKVEHYQQNINDNYTLAQTENLNGTTGETATATAKSYTGFTYDSNVSGTVGSGTTAADGSLVLKMYYTRNSYTLTFDANGGTGGSSTQVKHGAEIAAPNVTKTGYTFANWSPDVASTMPTQDTTYTAGWVESNTTAYKVEHYQQNISDNNYSLAETENLYGTTGATATATAESYTGFTYDSNVSGTVGSGTIAADGSLVLKMYYTCNSYTLTFDANGGTGGSSTQVKYGAEIAAPNVTKTGYTFANWSPDVSSTMPSQDTTYTAQWTESTNPFGAGTLEDPYLIGSFANLKWVSDNNTANTGFSGKYFKQTADIDMSPTTLETWIPIGEVTNKFNGTYDGNGFSVENLCINTETIRQGLFGVIGDTGTVTDLGVTSVDITCSAHNNTTGALTGALVGILYGSILRCYSTGTVSGDGNIGGLVGYSYGGTITDSYSRCTVLGNGASLETSWDQAGGLLGKLALISGRTGSVLNCYATGNVIAENHDQIGGLVGEIDTNQEVYSSFATGTLTGNTNVGGISGVLQGPMYNSYTTNGTFKGSAEGTIIGGNTDVALSWFMDILNFTAPENWHETHQWDFVNAWAINPSINDGLPYLKKSKLGR